MLTCSMRDSRVYSRTSRPPMVTRPPSTSQNRAIRLQRVVLPEPEGPTMAVVVLSGMVRDTSFRMGRLP